MSEHQHGSDGDLSERGSKIWIHPPHGPSRPLKTPFVDQAAEPLSRRYPRKSQPSHDDPLHDVWVGVFNAITATDSGRSFGGHWLFSTRLDASERVWAVVEPLLRATGQQQARQRDEALATIADAFDYMAEYIAAQQVNPPAWVVELRAILSGGGDS
jgi:hypothetical protein